MEFGIGTILGGSNQEHGDSQELRMMYEAEKFRRLAALAWSRETIYPKSEYIDGSSSGQCGVTNYGFGLWLSRLNIVDVGQMFFGEGKIVTTDGLPVGDDHTWLRVDGVDDGYTHPDLVIRFDLAGDQFPSIEVPVVVQHDDYFYPDPNTPSGNRIYQADRVTHFPEHDISRFAGRIDRFMDNIRG